MEHIFEENKKKDKIVSLEEFRKRKEQERTIEMLRLPVNASDEDIDKAWKEWWEKEVSFD